ncbi:hypothetical protein [Marinitenerispora sediminis]|uniref:Uncharacterized protein n=1 Tax=Marinitenerispora sediminis TaxID=1931232 RepID=A0A368T9L3_9ACTN|nr:hypothetical protein [Marinitenerispora sediminis]RCV55173.1 hypothetical protein DEF28_06625 [Marinitenerispora sediminis]RCV61259.1 hypothetical protein DEF24_04795 [Marinitenerispora sediminis]RCV61530.1 hypothetical protein DEF23_02110 [Marinitenerispora sediminis]
MRPTGFTVFRAALRLADPAVGTDLLKRLPEEAATTVASRYGLPERVAAALVESQPDLVRAVLAPAERDGGLDRRLYAHAAALGDPEAGRVLYNIHRWAEVAPGLRAAVLATADPGDPGWYTEDGLVPALLRSKDADTLHPALAGPFPEVVAHAVRELGSDLPLPVLLDACAVLADRGGADAVARLAEQVAEMAHAGLADTLRAAAAAPDPGAFLRARRPGAEWTDVAAVGALLRVRRNPQRLGLPCVPLDWELVRREHERRPFEGAQFIALSEWPDCPQEFVMAGFRSAPRMAAKRAARLPMEVLSGEDARADRFGFEKPVQRALASGWWSPERLLAEVAPAHRIVAALPYGHAATRTAVADALAPLGADPSAWLTLYARLPRFDGPFTALVSEAATAKRRSTRWPRPLEAAFPATPPEKSRAVFLDLLMCASEEARLAVVPHLDARAVQHLLVYGRPSERVRDAVVAAHGTPALTSFAAASSLPERDLAWLLDLDDPDVNASLFAHCAIPQAERVRMLAGERRDGGREPVGEPLLRELDGTNLGHYRHWLTAGIGSGDVGVTRVLLDRIRLHTLAGRLRLLVALGERNGAEAVRDVAEHPRFPAMTRRLIAAALEDPDPVATLRRRLEAEEQPERLAATLLAEGARPGEQVKKLLSEGGSLPWPELERAHTAAPFPSALLLELVHEAGCPRSLQLALLRTPPSGSRHYRGQHGLWWLTKVLDEGLITPADVLELSPEPRRVLGYLNELATSNDDRPRLRARFGAETRRLARTHLGADPEAWTVAVRLFPEFAGTLPELFRTAAAITA